MARKKSSLDQGSIDCYCKASKGFATQFDLGTKASSPERQKEVLEKFVGDGIKPQYQRGKELVDGKDCTCILRPSITKSQKEFAIRHAKTPVGEPIVGKSRNTILKNVNSVTVYPSPEYSHGIFDKKGKLLPKAQRDKVRVIRTE